MLAEPRAIGVLRGVSCERSRTGTSTRRWHMPDPLRVATIHGWFNVAGGVWPLVHLRSFEAVLGPKVDRWLVYTVAGLMVSIGSAQLCTTADAASIKQARRAGVGCALTLGAVDLVYAPRRRISRMYLVDAVVEAAWIAAWAATVKARGPRTDGWLQRESRIGSSVLTLNSPRA